MKCLQLKHRRSIHSSHLIEICISTQKKVVVENTNLKTFAKKDLETFFDSYNSQIYGLIVKIETLPFKQKEILRFGRWLEGSVRYIPNLFSVSEFSIPVLGLTLNPVSLREEIDTSLIPMSGYIVVARCGCNRKTNRCK